MAFPTAAHAASRTIGPVTTESGISCYLSNSLQPSVSSIGLPDLTYGSGWSCTPGAGGKQIGGYSQLSDELTERVADLTTGKGYNYLGKTCSDPNHCSQSEHFRRLPGASYWLVSEPSLRSFYTLNGDPTDDDFFEFWPEEHCQGFRLFPNDPGANLVRCTFGVTL
ncbi:MAG: hypothetical protein ACRDL6_01910 [Solirubrobacterales bacterium]